jgi:site-specific recombinase XerD
MWSNTMAIQRFRAYLQRRNYSEHTLNNYTLDLQLFFAAIDRPMNQVSCRDIDGFIDHQHHQG